MLLKKDYGCYMRLFLSLFFTILPFIAQANSEKISTQQALTLGVVQGLTEFLPVSSTGHMILVNECCFQEATTSKHTQNALNNYMVCIQLGTIFTLLLFYRKDVFRIICGVMGKDKVGFKLGWNVGLAFIPAGLVGFLLDDFIQRFYNRTCVANALVVGGFALLIMEYWRSQNANRKCKDMYAISWFTALCIGLFQIIALWPGFSRSLATIMGGICVGLSLVQAIHFSFLLGLLTSLVATGYKFLKNGSELLQLMDGGTCFLGIFVSFLVGISAIYFFFSYLQKNGLTLFGYYRIFIGIVLFVF